MVRVVGKEGALGAGVGVFYKQYFQNVFHHFVPLQGRR